MIYAKTLTVTTLAIGQAVIQPQAKFLTRLLVLVDVPSALVTFSLAERAGGNFIPRQLGGEIPLPVNAVEFTSREWVFDDPPEILLNVFNRSAGTVNVTFILEMDPNPDQKIDAILEELGEIENRLSSMLRILSGEK